MPCTPFSIGVGLFDNSTGVWKQDSGATKGGKTVTRSVSGTTVTYAWTGPTGGGFQSATSPNQVKYMFVGTSNTLLILFSQFSVNSATHYVSIIDFTTMPPTARNVLTGSSTATGSEPRVEFSLPDGNAVLVYSSGSTGEIENLAIYRGDNAALLLPGFGPYTPTGETEGEATATNLLIHYSTSGVSKVLTGPLPAGSAHITPSPVTFPQTIVGGPPSTQLVTIRNSGTDCLLINSITNAPPFSAPATTTSLTPGASTTVTVSFTPTAAGATGNVSLPVSRTPANGDAAIICKGTARLPVKAMSLSATSLGFGTVPVSTTRTLVLTIRNSGAVGDLPITVNVAASTSGPFTWAAFGGTLSPMGATTINVTFSPTAAGSANATLTVTSDAPTSPVNVALSGTGCVPTAQIAVPPPPFPSFGNVEHGFRLVRTISVQNMGSGPLSFDAHITGTDAALFGLPLDTGSITDMPPSRTYVVDPVTACGALATGSGSVVVAVEFFANDVPRIASANLVIDNATDSGASSWTFPLSATITTPAPIDAIGVFDRSASMADLVGARSKSEAAIHAGQLLVELLPPDANNDIALVRFNQKPEIVQAMAALTAANQPAIAAELDATSLAPSGSTSIAGGVLLGLTQTTRTVANLRKAMIVLTDGMDNTPYLNPADGKLYSITGGWVPTGGFPFGGANTLPIPTVSGVKIFGVGIGRAADIDIGRLNILSQATGAYFGVVGDLTGTEYFNLEKYFAQIYMDIANSTPLLDPVFTIHCGETQVTEFDVLRGDVSALVIVFDRDGQRIPFFVRTPHGEVVDPAHVPTGFGLRSGITHTARFLDIRMPANDPDHYAGRWAVVVKHPGYVCFEEPSRERQTEAKKNTKRQIGFISRECKPTRAAVMYGLAIGVGSNFRMQPYVTPGIVKVGEPILLTAVVSEAGLPVVGCTVTVVALSPTGAEYRMTLVDDGAHQDGEANDGEYARAFTRTDEEGSYTFTFRAVGRSRGGEPVMREATRAKYVAGRIEIGPNPGPSCCDPKHGGHAAIPAGKPGKAAKVASPRATKAGARREIKKAVKAKKARRK